jgi:hypothetical protein
MTSPFSLILSRESTTLPFATAKSSSGEKKDDPLFYALELVNFDFKKAIFIMNL